jgi:hypothetical protein
MAGITDYNANFVRPYDPGLVRRRAQALQQPTPYDDLFIKYGRMYGIDPIELKLRALVESGFNPTARSPAGAVGLMQFMPSTARELGINPMNPEEAVKGAAQLMAEALKSTGSMRGVDMTYYGGPNPKQWGPNTRQYAANLDAVRRAAGVGGGEVLDDDDPRLMQPTGGARPLRFMHPETGETFAFPAGTTGEQARALMDAKYAQREQQAQARAAEEAKAYRQYLRDNNNAIASGVRRGIGQLPILGAQALAAGAGTLGATGVRDSLLDAAAQRQDQLNQDAPQLYDSFMESPLGYLGERLGEQVPNMAAVVAGGGIGGLTGRALVARSAAGAARQAAARAATTRRGAIAGATVPSYGLQAGENYGSYVDEYGVDKASPGAALLGAIPQTALDVWALGRLGRMLTPQEISSLNPMQLRRLSREGMAMQAARGAARGLGRGVVIEAPTEAGQESLKYAFGDMSQGQAPTAFLSDPEKRAQVGEAGFVGGLTGGTIGGIGGGIGGARRPALAAERFQAMREGRRNEVEARVRDAKEMGPPAPWGASTPLPGPPERVGPPAPWEAAFPPAGMPAPQPLQLGYDPMADFRQRAADMTAAANEPRNIVESVRTPGQGMAGPRFPQLGMDPEAIDRERSARERAVQNQIALETAKQNVLARQRQSQEQLAALQRLEGERQDARRQIDDLTPRQLDLVADMGRGGARPLARPFEDPYVPLNERDPILMRSTDEETASLPGMEPALLDDGVPGTRDETMALLRQAGIVADGDVRPATVRNRSFGLPGPTTMPGPTGMSPYDRAARALGERMASNAGPEGYSLASPEGLAGVYNELVNLRAILARQQRTMGRTPRRERQAQALDALINSVRPTEAPSGPRTARPDADTPIRRPTREERETSRAQARETPRVAGIPAAAQDVAQVADKVRRDVAEGRVLGDPVKDEKTGEMRPRTLRDLLTGRKYTEAKTLAKEQERLRATPEELAAGQKLWDSVVPAGNLKWSDLPEPPVIEMDTGKELTGGKGKAKTEVDQAIVDDVRNMFALWNATNPRATPEQVRQWVTDAINDVRQPTLAKRDIGPKAQRKRKDSEEDMFESLADSEESLIKDIEQQLKKPGLRPKQRAELEVALEDAREALRKLREDEKASNAREATREPATLAAPLNWNSAVDLLTQNGAALFDDRPSSTPPLRSRRKATKAKNSLEERRRAAQEKILAMFREAAESVDAEPTDTVDDIEAKTRRAALLLPKGAGTPMRRSDHADTATRLRRLAQARLPDANIVVVADRAELTDPEALAAFDAGELGLAASNGSAYVFVPNHRTIEDAEVTLFHEPGHLFMRAVPVSALARMMEPFRANQQVQKLKDAWLANTANRERMAQRPGYDWDTHATEEAIVEFGQTAFGKPTITALAARVINWVRRLGGNRLADFLAGRNDKLQVVEFLIEMRRRYAEAGAPKGPPGPSRFRTPTEGNLTSTSASDLEADRRLNAAVDRAIGSRGELFRAAWGNATGRAGRAALMSLLDLRSLGRLLDDVASQAGIDRFQGVGMRIYNLLNQQDAVDQGVRATFMRDAINPLVELRNANQPMFERVQSMLYKASFMRFDPRTKVQEEGKGSPEIRAQRLELQRQYNALNPQARRAFDQVFDSTRRSFEEMTSQMRAHAERMLAAAKQTAANATPDERAAAQADVLRRVNGLEKLNRAIEELGNVMPYVPFRRAGDFLISYIHPSTKVPGVRAFETAAQRDRAFDAMRRLGVKQAEKFNRYEEPSKFFDSLDATTKSVIRALREARGVDPDAPATPSDPSETGRAQRGDPTPEEVREAVFAQIEDNIIDVLRSMSPAGRMFDAAMKRENYPGFDENILEALSAYATSAGRNMSNLLTGAEIGEAFADANRMRAASVTRPGMEVNDPSTKTYLTDDQLDSVHAVVGELNKRREFLMAPFYSPVANTLTKGGFYFFMGLNPSSALLQAFQMVMVQAPVLAGRYGVPRAFRSMWSAATRVYGTEAPLRSFLDSGEGYRLARYDATMLNPDGSAKEGADTYTRDYARLRTSSRRTDQYRAMMVDMLRRGIMNDQATQELNDMREGKDPTRVAAKVEHYMSLMMKHMEQTNRMASTIAAFDLAARRGRSWEDVMNEVEQAVYEGHGNYSALNSPRPWHSNTGKVLLLFRKFAFHMFTTMGMMVRDYIRAQRGSQERREAATKLGMMLLTTGALTGAAGLPLYGVAQTLFQMFQSAFGDEEETRNLTIALHKWAEEKGANRELVNVAMGGIPSLLGLNLTSRLGYADVFFRDPDENLDQKKALEWAVQTIGGPMYGAGAQIARGISNVANGNIMLGASEMVGAMPRNLAKGLDMYMSGEVTTRRGDVIAEVGAGDALLQAFGFVPGDVQRQQQIIFAAKAADVRLNSIRAEALNLYRNAYAIGDADMMERAKTEIERVNAIAARNNLPKYRITQDTLTRSVRARFENDENFVSGVRFAPATAPATASIRALIQ